LGIGTWAPPWEGSLAAAAAAAAAAGLAEVSRGEPVSNDQRNVPESSSRAMRCPLARLTRSWGAIAFFLQRLNQFIKSCERRLILKSKKDAYGPN
jgi:hypothetical protein